MTHTSPHPDEIRHWSRRHPHESYATVKRAMRLGYKYPLWLSGDNESHLIALDDEVINTAQVLPQTTAQKRWWKMRHPQSPSTRHQTVWFEDAEIATYIKMLI
jgi:hypothetical protein